MPSLLIWQWFDFDIHVSCPKWKRFMSAWEKMIILSVCCESAFSFVSLKMSVFEHFFCNIFMATFCTQLGDIGLNILIQMVYIDLGLLIWSFEIGVPHPLPKLPFLSFLVLQKRQRRNFSVQLSCFQDELYLLLWCVCGHIVCVWPHCVCVTCGTCEICSSRWFTLLVTWLALVQVNYHVCYDKRFCWHVWDGCFCFTPVYRFFFGGRGDFLGCTTNNSYHSSNIQFQKSVCTTSEKMRLFILKLCRTLV